MGMFYRYFTHSVFLSLFFTKCFNQDFFKNTKQNSLILIRIEMLGWKPRISKAHQQHMVHCRLSVL